MNTKRVVVADCDALWPEEFEKIAQPVRAALGELALCVEHVGSTAVPGLCAKPIIDLDVVIKSENELAAATEKLAALGYVHEGDLGVAGREAFCYENKPELMRHHLYVCAADSAELRRHLALRDYLRTHHVAAAEYGRVKREGAALYPNDIDAYIKHKGAVIESIYKECGL